MGAIKSNHHCFDIKKNIKIITLTLIFKVRNGISLLKMFSVYYKYNREVIVRINYCVRN